MIVRRFKINMIPGGKMAEVALSQYDSDVTLEFELYASDGTFVVESGTTAVFRGSKPDKNGISVAAELESIIDPETGKNIYLATVDVIPQMTAVAGRSLYELSLQKGGEELNTANFILDIERAPLDADTLPSESVIRELVDVIDKADEIIAAAEAVTTAIDDTLTQQGKAADAKKVGDEINDIKAELSEIFSNDAKDALLNCFAHIVFTDDDADYYGNLRNALYADAYPRITAIFNPGTHHVYHLDSLDTLKPYLTVKYYETSESTGTVVADSDYTLSGNLVEGDQTITVSYSGLRATFSVSVTNPFLYRLANTPVAVDGVTPVDTGFKLLSENRSFTIVCNFIDNRNYPFDTTEGWAFSCYTTASPYQGLYLQVYDGGNISGTNPVQRKIRHIIRCTPPGNSGGQTIFDNSLVYEDVVGRNVRICFAYNSETGKCKALCSVNGNVITPTDETFNFEFVTIQNNLFIGGRRLSDGYEAVMNCVFNDFKVFDSALSDAEMQTYIEEVA